MLEHLKIDNYDVGAKIICTTNTCKTLRALGIYNKFAFTIQKYDGNTVYLDDIDTSRKQICFNKSLLKSNFESNYAMNFYNAQGQQFKNIYVPDSSINNSHMSGRMAYTIISRLKENINKDFIIDFND
jgi:ATP-dependent exoDNAse (exonuclease V) alpha subunit